MKYMPMFEDDFSNGVHAIELIAQMFYDNDMIHSYNLTPLVKKLAATIDKIPCESPKKATLMSFLQVFMVYKS